MAVGKGYIEEFRSPLFSICETRVRAYENETGCIGWQLQDPEYEIGWQNRRHTNKLIHI